MNNGFEAVQIHERCFKCRHPFREGDALATFRRPWVYRYGKTKKRAERRVKTDHWDLFLVHRRCLPSN